MVQRLPNLDIRPLDKQSTLDDTANLRTNLRHHEGLGAPRQLSGQHLALGFYADDRDFGGDCLRRWLATGAAAQHGQNDQGQENCGGYQVFGDYFRGHSSLCDTEWLESAPSCEANVQEN
ncbi:hypothetical protein AO284_40935 [Pseudomonas sp. NZIPFR-PS2]|nr:hypothetical protein AO284_40935 [Pseudomonas sp. NZIPFR-PS2]